MDRTGVEVTRSSDVAAEGVQRPFRIRWRKQRTVRDKTDGNSKPVISLAHR